MKDVLAREGLSDYDSAVNELGLLDCSVEALLHAGETALREMLLECSFTQEHARKVVGAVFLSGDDDNLQEYDRERSPTPWFSGVQSVPDDGAPVVRSSPDFDLVDVLHLASPWTDEAIEEATTAACQAVLQQVPTSAPSNLPPWIAAILAKKQVAAVDDPEHDAEEEEECGDDLENFLLSLGIGESSDEEESEGPDVLLAPRAVFVGCARDCAMHLAGALGNMETIALCYFGNNVAYIFFQNDSTDSTLEDLHAFAASCPMGGRREVLSEQGLDARMPKRTWRLAYARNRLLARLAERGWLQALEVLVVFDMDDVNAHVNLAGVGESVRLVTCNRMLPGALDVATANQSLRYYDRWALRTESVPGNTWARRGVEGQHNLDVGLDYFFPPGSLPTGCSVGHAAISVDSAVVPVRSAFGGLALYRGSVLRNEENEADLPSGVAYDGADDTMVPSSCFKWLEGQDCEHAPFHLSLRSACRASGRGDLRVGIVPRMINASPVTIAPRATLSVNPDGTYNAGLEGVVSYTKC